MQLIIGNIHIQISKFGRPMKDRVHLIYARRRKNGLCTQCGKPVKEINDATGLLYRKCLKHRNIENKKANKRNKNKYSVKERTEE